MEPTGTPPVAPFRSLSGEALLRQLQSSPTGLTTEEAGRRLEVNAGRRLGGKQRTAPFLLLLSQFKSPIILLLIIAAGLSMFVGERTEALIIFLIVFVSGLLGFWQEHSATDAVEKLLAVVQIKACVRRDGKTEEIALHADPARFRTGWFVESVVTASMIVLVIRTRGPFFRSKPGPALLYTTLAAVIGVLLLPYLPLGRVVGLVPLTPLFLMALAVIMLLYVLTTEIAKTFFYRNVRRLGSRS